MNLLLDNISKKNIDEIFYLGFKEVIGYNHNYNIEYKKVSNYYVFSIKLIELDMMKNIYLDKITFKIDSELCGGREIKHNPPLNITKYTEESDL